MSHQAYGGSSCLHDGNAVRDSVGCTEDTSGLPGEAAPESQAPACLILSLHSMDERCLHDMLTMLQVP